VDSASQTLVPSVRISGLRNKSAKVVHDMKELSGERLGGRGLCSWQTSYHTCHSC
jgi:hypothetical protein